jgi:hypothetical protein
MNNTPVPFDSTESNGSSWTAEITLVILIVAWVLYELYGRVALEWLSAWTTHIRLIGGALLIAYLWYTVKETPDGASTALDLAKQFIKEGSGGGTREKRNVTGLMKKKVAADQGWKCAYCGSTLDESYQVDHKLALFKGGSNDISNLAAVCCNCHAKKTMAERLA